MYRPDRAVTPVISTILMIAIVVILAATISLFVLDFGGEISDPAPSVADTTGEFVVDASSASDNQFVRITHIAGESVAVEDIEIVVQADASDDDDFLKIARLVGFPNPGEQDPDEIIDDDERGIDFNTWSTGRTIEFRINTGDADFRIPEENTGPVADTLEVRVVHTPSGTVISENKFTP